MKVSVSRIVVAVCVSAICGVVNADMLDFEDTGVPYSGTFHMENVIPDGYGGFNWDNFWVGPESPGYGGFGCGAVSGSNVAYTAFGPASISVAPGLVFDFLGACLTGFWGNDVIQLKGFSGESLLYELDVLIVNDAPTWFDFDFLDIDRLQITSTYGFDSVALMDNFTFSAPVAAVPVPGAALLGMLGLGYSGWRLRRTR